MNCAYNPKSGAPYATCITNYSNIKLGLKVYMDISMKFE